MKYIELAQGKKAMVSDEDYPVISQHKWQLWKRKGNCDYAMRKICKDGKRTTITMHQEILGTPTGMVSDHINGNGLDNRRENLRVVSFAENCQNRKAQVGSSLFKGVSRKDKSDIWRARIKEQGKIYHLGYYPSEIEAAKAYDRAAKDRFGEYARINTY